MRLRDKTEVYRCPIIFRNNSTIKSSGDNLDYIGFTRFNSYMVTESDPLAKE